MFDVPDEMPFTIPFAAPTVATVISLLLHTPPPAEFVSVTVELRHTFVAPDIVPADGNVCTVTVAVALAVPQLLV